MIGDLRNRVLVPAASPADLDLELLVPAVPAEGCRSASPAAS